MLLVAYDKSPQHGEKDRDYFPPMTGSAEAGSSHVLRHDIRVWELSLLPSFPSFSSPLECVAFLCVSPQAGVPSRKWLRREQTALLKIISYISSTRNVSLGYKGSWENEFLWSADKGQGVGNGDRASQLCQPYCRQESLSSVDYCFWCVASLENSGISRCCWLQGKQPYPVPGWDLGRAGPWWLKAWVLPREGPIQQATESDSKQCSTSFLCPVASCKMISFRMGHLRNRCAPMQGYLILCKPALCELKI